MALPKVCGIETEYGIVVRGAENNPVSASSLLINAYIAATTSPQRGRVGWDFDDEHPANDARGFSLDDVIAPEIETTLVNAVLTNGARYYVDHAHPEISIPEVADRPRGRALGPRRRGDHPPQHGPRLGEARAGAGGPAEVDRPQEQLRRQGQQLRLPRELPAGPGDAVRPHRRPGHAALRHPPDLHRRRQGRLRAARRAQRPRAVPAQPAGRLLRGGGRARDDAQAADRQHPRRAALRRPEVPPPPRHRRRRQHERGRHLPQGRHDGDRAGDDRGRRPRRRLAARQPGVGDPPGEPRPDADPHDHAARRPPGDGAGDPVGPARAGPQVRAAARAGLRRRDRRAATSCSRWEQRPRRPRARPGLGRPRGSTGSPSGASSTATPSVTASNRDRRA